MTYVCHMYSYVTYQHRILFSFFIHFPVFVFEWMKVPGKAVRPPAVEEALRKLKLSTNPGTSVSAIG